jgi:hypothetical protein
MKLHRRSVRAAVWAPAIACAVTLCLMGSASASDGVLEINQACAAGPGCFSGDSPGFPVTIAYGGSYRLTGNLSMNSVLGPPSTDFIEINAADVSLDLNGFALICRNVLTGTPCSGSNINGIDVASYADRARIANGALFGMPGGGIASFLGTSIRVENLSVDESGEIGIEVGSGSRVERCVVRNSGQRGIQAQADSIVVGNVVRDSTTVGISVADNSIVRENVVTGSGSAGIRASEGSLVQGNTSASNQTGFRLVAVLQVGGLARDNVARDNSGPGIDADSGWVLTSNVSQGNGS